MGRKRIKEPGMLDRIGEEVDLQKCPECREHQDCFGWREGRCEALKESGGAECSFYRPMDAATEEARQSYKKLTGKRRYDLIRKYVKPLTALGVMDDEIAEENSFAKELEAFKELDYGRAVKELEEEEAGDPND